MLKEAVAGAEEGAQTAGKKRPLLLGVTILTSMDEEDMHDLGIEGSVEEKVLELASMAKEAGMDGVVASARETASIKERCGKDFIVVTPGIRPEKASLSDQKRSVTPREAMEKGSDYIVVGRPVIQADDPLAAARGIIEEMGNTDTHKRL